MKNVSGTVTLIFSKKNLAHRKTGMNEIRLTTIRKSTRTSFLACVAIALTACGGGGGGSPAPVNTWSAKSGLAQKGPLAQGSTVTARELNGSLAPTGQQYTYQINSNLGTFSPTASFGSQYIDLTATGNYFDEVRNGVSDGTVTLNGYSDLGTDQVLNVNLLTTLAYQRIQHLAGAGMSFTGARAQAEGEVLAALHIPSGNYGDFGSLDLSGSTDGDHMLAALSGVFAYGNSAGSLNKLIAAVQSDIAANGAITNSNTRAALSAASLAVDPTAVAANLTQLYTSVGVKSNAADISNSIYQRGDGVVGKFSFQVPNATSSSVFTVPTFAVNALAGHSVQVTAGQLTVSGSAVSSPVNISANDALTIVPGPGPFPDGQLTAYLTVNSTNIASVTFVRGLLSLAITPNPAFTGVGLTRQLTVTGTYSDGSALDVTKEAVWASGAPSVATVNPTTGAVNGIALGTTTVNVSFGSVSASGPLSVVTGQWTPGGHLLAPRSGHTAALLGNGKVLIAGGQCGPGSPNNVELYDPVTGTSQLTGSMVALDGCYMTSVALPDGRVLAIGEYDGISSQASAEIYDPSSGIWSKTPFSLSYLRYPTMTVLGNGKVLVAGGLGFGPAPLHSAELYDPVANTWTATGNLVAGRYYHTATLLPDGRVLVSGGAAHQASGAASAASAENNDPVAGSWSATTSMAVPRRNRTATALPDGRVLIAGGEK